MAVMDLQLGTCSAVSIPDRNRVSSWRASCLLLNFRKLPAAESFPLRQALVLVLALFLACSAS